MLRRSPKDLPGDHTNHVYEVSGRVYVPQEVKSMTTSRPAPERAPEPPADGFFARLKQLFSVGPFAWVTGSLPKPVRFRAGSHMHGLERHDIAERDVDHRRRGTDL